MNLYGQVLVAFSDPFIAPTIINSTLMDKMFTLKIRDNNSDKVYVRRFNDTINQESRVQALNETSESEISGNIN